MIKFCPNCKVEVGGVSEYCPLCQNELHIKDAKTGEVTDEIVSSLSDNANSIPCFPDCNQLKSKSFWYKLQMFIVLAAIVICLAIDFLIDINGDLHWSLIVLLWGIGFEFVLSKLLKKHSSPTYFVVYIAAAIGILLLPTAYYLNFMKICTNYILPCICMLALILNYTFFLFDKKGNALVFMLCNVLVGIIPGLVMIGITGITPLFWTICMVTTVVSLLALIIFNGSKVQNEIQKRLNF